MRTTGALRAVAGAALVMLLVTGCGAAGTRPDVSQPPVPPSTAAVAVPDDGVSLAAIGVTTGPVDRVFVPVGTQVSSRVDQPNNVALVLTAPSAATLYTFYLRTVVANGFSLTSQDAATDTLAFDGFGWSGTFTGDREASALLLRPSS